MMKLNWFYVFIALLFTAMIFISLRFFKGSRFSTVGITASREFKINAEKQALITAINVVPGQQVKKGDLLVELSSAPLELEMSKISNRIQVLTSERQQKARRTESTIDLIKADHSLERERLQTQIIQLENEIKLNKSLTKQFAKDTASASSSSSELKLQSLRQQAARQDESVQIKVKDILQQRDLDQQLMVNQIRLLENELEMIQKEKAALSKYATADGVISRIYVRQGEEVDAFTPLLSVDAVHPSTVVAYETVNKENHGVGSPVEVASYAHRHVVVSGKIIGFGAVVQLPEILQKATSVKAFGREVFIEIDANNGLATGEKVLVR
jgi:multidrug resistance efflux pump